MSTEPAKGQTEFIVVRHGETAWNAEGRIQGHLDSPLNEEGLAQAILVGERLRREAFDAFYCSDLGRTRQTAQPLADHSGKRPTLRAELRERHLGIFQGLTGAECERRYPEDYRRFHSRDPDHEVPRGESIRQMVKRVSDFFTGLSIRHEGQRIVVITHGGILDALHRFVRGIPLDKPRDFPVFNASINRVACASGVWSELQWGDISHLTRDAALDDF
ncbi:MAG: histidine phosphatase family protein [Betaproteobacteria bacterium]|nr:histidine phosphatase family protein [Betaproteobacteria bacterium]